MRLVVRVGLALAIVVVALMLLVGGSGGPVDVLAVLLLIGLLVARELTSAYTTREFRGRYDVFVWSGLALFLVIIVNRIRAILGL